MDSREVVAVPVQPDQVGKWRSPLEWHFGSFCKDGSLDPDTLWTDISQMKRQLWVGMKEKPVVAVLTEVKMDNFKTCVMTHAAGEDMKSWLHLWETIEGWAKDIGCGRIEAVARPGWERVLKNMKKTHVVLEKRL